jgi:prepilin-type N-terminal cleavage/methylation domain-containing protein
MILSNIKAMKKERGFTIVELLVVIVVIGILAAITIVSYTGITARANTARAQSNAGTVQSIAEVYASDPLFNHYPRATADFAASATAKLPAGIYLFYTGGTGVNATPSATNGATTVWYQYCGAIAAPLSGNETGGRIQYWDFGTNALSTNVVYVGTGAAGLGVGAGAVCNTWVTPAA